MLCIVVYMPNFALDIVLFAVNGLWSCLIDNILLGVYYVRNIIFSPLASSLFLYLCKCLCLLCIVVYMPNFALDIVLFAVNGLWSCLIDNILLGVYYVWNIIFFPLASSLFLYLCKCLCLLCIVVYMPNFALDIVLFAVNGLWSCLIDNILLGVYYVRNIIFSPLASSLFLYLCKCLCLLCIVVYMPNFALDIVLFAVNGLWSCLIDNILLGVYYVRNIIFSPLASSLFLYLCKCLCLLCIVVYMPNFALDIVLFAVNGLWSCLIDNILLGVYYVRNIIFSPLASSLFLYLCKCLCLLCIVVYMPNFALDIVLFAVNGLWSCLIDNILLGVYYVRNIIFSPLASSLFLYLCKCLCLLCIVVYMPNFALDIVLFAVNGLWSCLIDNILLGVYYVRNIIFSPLASSLFCTYVNVYVCYVLWFTCLISLWI